MIFRVDNLEALDNRKIMARRWLNGRQIVVHGAGLLFHHYKLLKGGAGRTRSWPTPKTLFERAPCCCGPARPEDPQPALIGAPIGRLSGERRILVVFGRGRITSLRTQNQR